MGYYTKDLSPESHCIITIVAKFGKLGYNMVPMGLCSSGEIFQDKIDDLPDYIK